MVKLSYDDYFSFCKEFSTILRNIFPCSDQEWTTARELVILNPSNEVTLHTKRDTYVYLEDNTTLRLLVNYIDTQLIDVSSIKYFFDTDEIEIYGTDGALTAKPDSIYQLRQLWTRNIRNIPKEKVQKYFDLLQILFLSSKTAYFNPKLSSDLISDNNSDLSDSNLDLLSSNPSDDLSHLKAILNSPTNNLTFEQRYGNPILSQNLRQALNDARGDREFNFITPSQLPRHFKYTVYTDPIP